MHIHTVKHGETIFKIARQHSVSPMKIIENNSLDSPDRLSVGQELLILTPTRTHTVRGNETLTKIAERFGVSYNDLLTMNPSLSGTDRVYHGQVLTLKQDTPPYSPICKNGYYYKDTEKSRLKSILPYLTHVTVGVGKRYGKDVHILFDDRECVKEIRDMKRIPLMRVVDTEGDRFDMPYLENLVLLTKTHGYGGLMLASYRAQRESAKEYGEFLKLLKERLSENGLSLHIELDGNGEVNAPADCDGYHVMYERAQLEDAPRVDEGEGVIMQELVDVGVAPHSFIELPTFAYMNDEAMSKKEAERLAYSSATEIKRDENTGLNSFEYNKYRKGKKERVRVSYESLENIKAKLDLVDKLGFMGVSFDINSIPTEYLMMLESLFRKGSLT